MAPIPKFLLSLDFSLLMRSILCLIILIVRKFFSVQSESLTPLHHACCLGLFGQLDYMFLMGGLNILGHM